ncbi:MAG: hypothetical protein EAY75_11025 [Bacteroidetes bacterium]|nr:MAG: hypothetical protein EAY75_11025 [Bacteroidota bacterium]
MGLPKNTRQPTKTGPLKADQKPRHKMGKMTFDIFLLAIGPKNKIDIIKLIYLVFWLIILVLHYYDVARKI